MGLYFPPELDWLGYVAGNAWPNEDEDAYWGLADDWSAACTRIRALLPDGGGQPNLGAVKDATARAYRAGAGRDAVVSAFDRLAHGDGSLADLADRMTLVIDAANATGSKIRELKLMIWESLILLAWELESAARYPPTAPLADAENIGRTRIYLQWLAYQARLEL
jgi:hypothetical protein